MGEVRIGSRTFTTREIVLGVVATLAVVVCIVFLGLYANKGGGGKSGATHSGAARQQATTAKPASQQTTTTAKTTAATTTAATTTATPAPTQATCTDSMCMETTAYVWSLVNTSVDPCEDFYSYACGKWAERNPLEPDESWNTVAKKLFSDNEKLIHRLIESAKLRSVPWSSERKVKDLYDSCLDDYGRTVAGGNPFIQKVIKKVGGWFVLQDNFDASSWDIMDHLEKVHVDHWTGVLFKVGVYSDYWNNRRGQHITLIPDGIGMNWYSYTSPYTNTTRQHYRKFMRTVGSYLVDDSGISITDDERKSRLDTFVNDVMEVETRIANLSQNSPYSYSDAFDYSEKVYVKDLAALTGPPTLVYMFSENNQYLVDPPRTRMTHATICLMPLFNWTSYFRYMFNGHVWRYTLIAVPSKAYAANLSRDIEQLGPDKNRKLNNYMIWRLAERYLTSMSSKYLHAGHDYLNDRFHMTEFTKAWERCFNFVRRLMPDAISHLFVENHFGGQNKAKVTEIAGYVRQALVDGLSSSNTFMDTDTKKMAISKINAIVAKFGYPAFMLDRDQVDLLYYNFTVSATDFFSNALSSNKLYKNELIDRYTGQWMRWWNPTQWQYEPYDTRFAYIRSWNEIEIPAGLLQHPVYDYHLAHYLNFGSMGNIIADTFINAVDYYGSRYNRWGNKVSSTVGEYTGWWTPATVVNFNSKKSCLADQFVNNTNTFIDPNTKRPVKVKTSRSTAEFTAKHLLDNIWGLKTGFQAYQAWVKKNGQEPLPPVVKLTPKQMYFVSYMQIMCRQTRSEPYYGRHGYLSLYKQYNAIIAQLDEFSQAFKCSATATLNPAKKCTLPN